MDGMTKHDLTVELWREYDFGGRVYRIENPKALYLRPGSSTHRVEDANGVVHCLPSPGQMGCVLRWTVHSGTQRHTTSQCLHAPRT